MKKFFATSFLWILSLGSILNSASLNLPVQKIGNTDFYVYDVTQKETIYSICKKLNISKDDILRYNPQLADGLKKGQKLFFPVKDFAEAPLSTPVVIPNQFNHVVQKGETLYGLSKIFNVSQEEIVAINPGVKDGIKTGEIIIIPQSNRTQNNSNPNVENNNITAPAKTSAVVYYTIKSGDTLFGVAKRYNTTIEDILALNPGISPSNFKTESTIKISPNTVVENNEPKSTNAKFVEYKVTENDSFQSLALSYGVTVSELQQANPKVKSLKKNSIIYIPVIQKLPAPLSTEEKVEKLQNVYDSVNNIVEKESVDIAIILPFMLNSATVDKQANLYTDFYKGFLLAVNEERKNTSKKINVSVYDTENSTEKINQILSDPKLKKVDVIYAPDDTNQLKLLSTFSKANDIDLVNIFVVKAEEYNNNEHFFQTNIPPSYMFAEVFDHFDNAFGKSEVLFLNNDAGSEKDIVPDLKAHLEEQGIKYQVLNMPINIKVEDLDPILQTGNQYVIIPTNSTRSTLSKLLPVLKTLKKDRIDVEFKLFGYPEWTSYIDDYRDLFKNVDTYIYTRFYANPFASDYKDFSNKFKSTYGTDMINSAPLFAMLGYDNGLFFLSQLGKYGKNYINNLVPFSGIQNDFNYQRISNWSGFVNKSLYFIHLSPTRVEKITK